MWGYGTKMVIKVSLLELSSWTSQHTAALSAALMASALLSHLLLARRVLRPAAGEQRQKQQ